jgi:hypothetical protein
LTGSLVVPPEGEIPSSISNRHLPGEGRIQIHPERLAGFTWAPAFAGETGKN